MELTDIDAILDKEFGKRGTPQRKAAIQQAKKELKADLRYYAVEEKGWRWKILSV